MKSILISIKPQYCELIASGKKTVEVRKTKPKLETPFKCYIYETQGKTETPWIDEDGHEIYKGRGQVIGEFICDKIYDITPHFDTPTFPNQYICGWEYGKEFDCLSFEEITSYLNGKKGYGYHITELVIYDEPRELSEFKTICRNAYCQNYWGEKTWFCKDGYSSCAVTDKEREFPYNEECIYFDCPSVGGESCEYEDYAYCNCNGLKPLTRPPQSWCYVESEDTE